MLVGGVEEMREKLVVLFSARPGVFPSSHLTLTNNIRLDSSYLIRTYSYSYRNTEMVAEIGGRNIIKHIRQEAE